jgi:GT2 family glycosyltransferase
MTLFQPVLSRLAPLFIGVWAGGGLILLSYFAIRWERRASAAGTSAIARFADMLFPSGKRLLPEQLAPPVADNLFSSAGSLRQVESRAHSLRTASVLKLEDPAESALVSVIIPTHNRARIIGPSIESALNQTYTKLQVVIADDGSSDDTRAVVESYGERITYVHQGNAGVSAARNLGLRHARGEFIAFLDSDDSWRPWKIEAQVAALGRHSEAGIVWTDMEAVDDAGRLINARHLREMYTAYAKVDVEGTLPRVDMLGALTPSAPGEFAAAAVREGDLFTPILLGNLIHTSTVLFRRSWLERTGGFDESFSRAGEDYEFYVRLCSAGPAVFIDAPSTVYRVGAADQLTRPAMALEIARNNLRAIEKWVPISVPQLALSPRLLRRRFAESFAWLGQAELDAGHRWQAVRCLSKSLAVMPRLDRRAVLLVKCAVPDRALQGFRAVRHAIVTSNPGQHARGLPT